MPAQVMVSVADILQHIAQEFGDYPAPEKSGIKGRPAADACHMRISVATDLEDSELRHLKAYGMGCTLYFRIRDRQQGQRLASDLYDIFQHVEPDTSLYSELMSPEPLYLFIHIRGNSPKALCAARSDRRILPRRAAARGLQPTPYLKNIA